MIKLSMNFSDESTFILEEYVAYAKDKMRDQYNIIFLDSDEGDKDNKVFIAKGSSFYIWKFFTEGKNYSEIISSLREVFEPFEEDHIDQVDEFLKQMIERGFLRCKN